jgi:hypothetical protein
LRHHSLAAWLTVAHSTGIENLTLDAASNGRHGQQTHQHITSCKFCMTFGGSFKSKQDYLLKMALPVNFYASVCGRFQPSEQPEPGVCDRLAETAASLISKNPPFHAAFKPVPTRRFFEITLFNLGVFR